jgi:hypothetical protein
MKAEVQSDKRRGRVTPWHKEIAVKNAAAGAESIGFVLKNINNVKWSDPGGEEEAYQAVGRTAEAYTKQLEAADKLR